MAKSNSTSVPEPIGDRLRAQRVESLKRSLRQVAVDLDITPAHLTDIEKGRRTPSDELLMRIARVYRMEEPILRAAWSKPEAVVREVASSSATTAEKVPQFLRTARNLTSAQWDQLIEQARSMTKSPKEP
ncbi:MAG: helix-turn-helix transcriptional regulator [Phycisphaeraceae bacterium]|nr:helix-turn-helix transcriptional regulator [Phycisphaeraceae bacterium]